MGAARGAGPGGAGPSPTTQRPQARRGRGVAPVAATHSGRRLAGPAPLPLLPPCNTDVYITITINNLIPSPILTSAAQHLPWEHGRWEEVVGEWDGRPGEEGAEPGEGAGSGAPHTAATLIVSPHAITAPDHYL